MDQLLDCADRLVSSGFRAYVGLLSCGEQERSRRVLADTMQISSLIWGGPSALATIGAVDGNERDPTISSVRCMAFFTLRSLLASLLVLRATAYWTRVPALEELQHRCAVLNRCLAVPELEGREAAEAVG